MFGLEFLAKLVKILRSADSPNQIASGFVIGMVIGLTPFWTLHNLILIVILIILNINHSFIISVIFSWSTWQIFKTCGHIYTTSPLLPLVDIIIRLSLVVLPLPLY